VDDDGSPCTGVDGEVVEVEWIGGISATESDKEEHWQLCEIYGIL
jgi:hypothetical protein